MVTGCRAPAEAAPAPAHSTLVSRRSEQRERESRGLGIVHTLALGVTKQKQQSSVHASHSLASGGKQALVESSSNSQLRSGMHCALHSA